MEDEICIICGELRSPKTLGKTMIFDPQGQFITEVDCSHGFVPELRSDPKKAIKAAIKVFESAWKIGKPS